MAAQLLNGDVPLDDEPLRGLGGGWPAIACKLMQPRRASLLISRLARLATTAEQIHYHGPRFSPHWDAFDEQIAQHRSLSSPT